MNIGRAVSRVVRGDDEAAPDALTLLKSDHREVAGLFEKALGENTPAAEKRTAIKRVVDALDLHARMEEAIFYPALRAAGGSEERDSVLEAAEEHASVKELIAKIRASRGRDETLKAKVTVLKEQVEHHVEEEESTLFDEARRVLGDERLADLGAEMFRFKQSGGRSRGGRKTSGRKTAGRTTARRPATARKTGGRTAAATRKTAGRKTATTARKTGGRKTAGRKRR